MVVKITTDAGGVASGFKRIGDIVGIGLSCSNGPSSGMITEVGKAEGIAVIKMLVKELRLLVFSYPFLIS